MRGEDADDHGAGDTSDAPRRRPILRAAVVAIVVVSVAAGYGAWAKKATIARHLRRAISHEPEPASAASGGSTTALRTTDPSGPAPAEFPTPATTGWAPTGATLVPYDGPDVITDAGTVIDGRDIDRCLTIRARDVTIRRSRVRCAGDVGVRQDADADGLLLEDVEVTSGADMVDRAIRLTNGATLRRLYVHDTQRGIAVGSNTLVEQSYVGDNRNGTDAHSSALMTSGGTRHVIVRHNTLQTAPDTNATSAISFYPELTAGGANDDVLIEGNLLNSGGGYATYLGHTARDGESPNTHLRFVGNRFGTRYFPDCGMYGPSASWSADPTNTWSGNTWYDLRPTTPTYTNKDGQPVEP